MELATVMSVVQTLLSAIQSLDQLKVTRSISEFKRELTDLQSTVDTIRCVLEDAEAKQDGLNSQERNYIEELKDAVYDADDVIDEFVTLAKRNQLNEDGDKVTVKVRSFICRLKSVTCNMSNKVKKVNKKLNAIATISSKFSFKVDNRPFSFRKGDTSSFVAGRDRIIGRDDEVEEIVAMLLNHDAVDQPQDVCFLAIVGMGGLGKTALAQLVYNDSRVTSAFEVKSWTCIADQDQDRWNLTELLGKVLRDIPVDNKHDVTSLQQIQHGIQRLLGGKRYLLVLDDVWSENYHRWQEFEGFLNVGKRGSRIVVTTRSKTTAQLVAGGRVHELQGLSANESWHLFERMAFLPEQRETVNDELVKLGEEILKMCINVPLAIRVVGSVLRGQSKTKWLSFQDKGLTNISESNDAMSHILKLSYHQLDSSLKSCFAYCAIFPKALEINKQMLINQWMAQGYISRECVGEEYFLTLLQRCFFQDICKDEYGEIRSVKLHDLLHDIAEQVVGEEIVKLNSNSLNVGKKARHLSFLSDVYAKEIDKTRIRTYLQVGGCWSKVIMDQLLAGKSITKWTCLRTLDLSGVGVEILPDLIGDLLHLRYLDLSWNKWLKELPKSITKLLNLQSLNLYNCSGLQKLPKDISKLVNMSTLNLTYCSGLSHMPTGIGKLTSLHTLGQFLVGRPSSNGEQCFDGLDDLRCLNNLKDHIDISIAVYGNIKYVKEEHGGGEYLRSKEDLKSIDIRFIEGEKYGNIMAEQALLEDMQPHLNLKNLRLRGYHGVGLPRWSRVFDLPNLVSLIISDCRGLLCLPSFGELPHLKDLGLLGLESVEYVMDVRPPEGSSLFPKLVQLYLGALPNLEGWWPILGSPEESPFFPSLEHLYLSEMPNLKGWWPRLGSEVNISRAEPHLVWVSYPCFPQLKKLRILDCPKITTIPATPCLENLWVKDANRTLKLQYLIITPCNQISPWSNSASHSKPRKMTISNVEWLKSMPREYFNSLAGMVISHEKKGEDFLELTELLDSCLLSSPRFVHPHTCPQLRSVGGWLNQLSSLDNVCISETPDLPHSIPWGRLPESLRCLNLVRLAYLKELPEEMQYCTSLQSLIIWNCPQLQSLPNWMPKLTCLRTLQLRYCSVQLKDRCRELHGEDWHLIQHIPLICIRAAVGGWEEMTSDPDTWVQED